MHQQGTAPAFRPPAVTRDGVLFLYSPNLGIRIRYGSLLVDLGRGRTLIVDRASEPRLRRLVLCGRGGWWTFEVPAWLSGIGASWMQLDLTGRILGSGPGDVSPDLPALRRQQALASGTEVGRLIGVDLLTRKIEGQAAALLTLPGTEEAQTLLRGHVAVLANCSDAEQLRAVEAQAAVVFWQTIADVPLRFIPSDEAHVPSFWRAAGRRASTITGAPRGASTPAHGLWNFAYACAAGEVEIALRGTGLDPGISPTGLHADTLSRSSATYDVLEAIRGDVDRLILAMILGRWFRRRDFVAQPDGRVRLTAPMAREVTEAVLPVARQAVAPIAEGLAQKLAAGESGSRIPRLPTNLSGDARSKGRASVRKGERRVPDTPGRSIRALVPPACLVCGVVLEERGRLVCDDCLPARKSESMARGLLSATDSLKLLRVAGRDPSHGGHTARKRGDAISRRMREAKEYETEVGDLPDPAIFQRKILPLLQSVPVRTIAAAIGLSKTYAGLIRRGLRVPHPRHWPTLEALGRPE